MEDRCLAGPGASTVTNQPLDSNTLPWLAIPATQPSVPTYSHQDTCHTVLAVEEEKKGGAEKKETNRPETSQKSATLFHAQTSYHNEVLCACTNIQEPLTAR